MSVSATDDVGSRQRTIDTQRRAVETQQSEAAARDAAAQRPAACGAGCSCCSPAQRPQIDLGDRRVAREGVVRQENERRAQPQQGQPSGGQRTARGLSDPAPSAARTNALRAGARGPEVEALQRSLNERGAQLEVDGRYGPRTQQAVRDYQTANPPLARDGIVGSRTRASLAKPASETNPIRPGTPAGPVDASNPRNMTAQQAAQHLLSSPNVSFWSGLSTGSDRANMQRIANGQNPIANATGRETTANPNMLRALVQMSNEGRIQINALTGGGHSTNSQHYRGNAVDLQPGVGLSTARIREIAAQYGGVKNNESHIHLTFAR